MEYFIVPVAELKDEMFEFSIQKSRDTLRYSVDGTRVVLKHSFDRTPAVFAGHRIFTHDEIRREMFKPEWNKQDLF